MVTSEGNSPLDPMRPEQLEDAISERVREHLVVYTEAEEVANTLTHAVGVILSILAFTLLVLRASIDGDPYRLFSVTIYGLCMLTFYTLSTVYHSVRRPYVKYIFRILDHSAIYLMIAGSYTPITLVTLRGKLGWALFGMVWGLALLGVLLRFFTSFKMNVVGPILYIALGWSVVIAIKPLSAALAPAGLTLLIAGGLAYTLGVGVYSWNRLPYNHAIWHVFVLAGSVLHFLSIFYYVTPLHV